VGANDFTSQVTRRGVPRRGFAVVGRKSTDGVFRELTNARVAVPWVEALRKRDAGEKDQVDGTNDAVGERELTPKRMRDSYHSVVRFFSSIQFVNSVC
jgi:acyl-coenzyme A thioesterase 9